jgi:FkbM family methyltransferase
MYKVLRSLAGRNTWFRSLIYNFYTANSQKKWFKKYWKKGWHRIILKNIDKPVHTRLHGYKAIVNCGFTYPLVTRIYKQFNNPLLELVYQVSVAKGRKLVLADIGAAVGDTVFLLQSNLPGKFEKIICIDGDAEFFSYLQKNMRQFPFVKCLHALLSDKERQEKNLIRTHAGTASAQGRQHVISVALDNLLAEESITIDLLKIDTDGFDGKILCGALCLLKKQLPYIIFEWHPVLYSKTGNDVFLPFKILEDAGYHEFVFFNKYGLFSHFMNGVKKEEIELYQHISLSGEFDNDWHYDIVALPKHTVVNKLELAECSFAKNKTSAF